MTVSDPCDPPVLSPATLTNQVYTVTDPAHSDYTHADFTVSPSYCPFNYSYSTTTILDSGDSAITRTDKTFAFFYDKEISDYATAKQVTTVTATSYSIYNTSPASPATTFATFDTTFLDPCLDPDFVTITATPSSRVTDNFSGSSLSYTVAFTVTPSFCDLTVECGEVQPAGSNISCIETDDGSVSYSFDLDDYTDETNPIAPGDYLIGYKVYTGPTADVEGLQTMYDLPLTLIDPCLSASITAAVPQNFEYTLTDVATDFPFVSNFSHSPVQCEHTFTAKTITSDANSLSSVLTFNEANQDWQISQVLDSLIHAGASSTTYTLSVTYNVLAYDGSVATSETVSFDLKIKNPCLDSEFVTIVTADVPDTDYRITDPAKTTPPFPAFTYTTQPGTHQLCGTFTYTVTDSDGNPVPTTPGADPITFNSGDRTFTLDSDDSTLDGTTETYTVTAAFTSYSGAETGSDNFDVDYIDPCEEPTALSATSQTGITDKFTNNLKIFTLNPFSVTPSRCVIDYSCDGITKDGAATSELSCSDLDFDGIIDGGDDDGTFKITVDP